MPAPCSACATSETALRRADHLRQRLLGERQDLTVGQIARALLPARKPRLDRVQCQRLLCTREQGLLMPQVDISERRARPCQDRFPDRFERRQMRTQEIEIHGVEQLQELIGRVAASGHSGQSGGFDGRSARRPLVHSVARRTNIIAKVVITSIYPL